MKRIFLNESSLRNALDIRPGVTVLVGGGGKTSAMLRLAQELRNSGTVIVTTTTHIWPPEEMPVLLDPTPEEIRAALNRDRAVCVGSLAADGKLCPCNVPVSQLKMLAEYVLVEGDGAKCLPLKAPADHEPVIPPEADCVVAVAGLSGIGKAIETTVFRPERYAKILDVAQSCAVTPEYVARVLCSSLGQRKNVGDHMRFCVLLNQADDAARVELAKQVLDALDDELVERAVVARLRGQAVSIIC